MYILYTLYKNPVSFSVEFLLLTCLNFQEDEEDFCPPFPELRYLNLANNKVCLPSAAVKVLVYIYFFNGGFRGVAIIYSIFSQIFEEDALLAVALLPLLSELVIHSNPLTTQRTGKLCICAILYFICHGNTHFSIKFLNVFVYYFFVLGDLPMLNWILQDRLGIKMRHKKSADIVKPHLLLSVNPKRKVIYPFKYAI